MKKLVLLLTVGALALSASAQERFNTSIVQMPLKENHQTLAIQSQRTKQVVMNTVRSHRTTMAGATGRWYSYPDFLDNYTGGADALSGLYLWNDTTSLDAYGNGSGGVQFDHNTMVSTATVLDPYFPLFDDPTTYDSTQVVFLTNWPTKSYVVDSVEVFGIYGFNPAKTSVVDTMIIAYTYGSGLPVNDNSTQDIWRSEFDNSFASSLLTLYGLTGANDTMWFNEVQYDSTVNWMTGQHASSQKILLTSADWGDTLSDGTFYHAYKLNTPMTVPAGDKVAVSFTFKSGDPSFTANDTVFNVNSGGSGYYKYNMFRQYISYGTASSSSTTPIFPTYSTADHNEGLYKTLPNFTNGWGNVYVPMYAWTSGGGASDLQYPFVDVHVNCATCMSTGVQNVAANTGNVKAYPNPAGSELNISYSVNQGSNVTINISNVLGQTVATKQVSNNSGVVTFNTTELPAGMYVYNVQAGAEHYSGHVVVAH